MERSQNFYGLFVLYRYDCVDVIVISSAFVVFIQTCFRSYSALHQLSAMITNYFELLKCILHRLLLLSFACDRASLSCHRLFSKIYIDKPRMSMSHKLKLLSLNVRGLHNISKQEAIFSFLKIQKATVFCL